MVSSPGINGTVSQRAVCGFNNDVAIILKLKCDSEVVLIANMYVCKHVCKKNTYPKALHELKNKELSEKYESG